MIIGDDLKFLLALLNSKTVKYFFSKFISVPLGKEGIIWAKQHMQILPIPTIDRERRGSFEAIVDEILYRKNSDSDTNHLEEKIDKMVYELYYLSEDEIRIVENERSFRSCI